MDVATIVNIILCILSFILAVISVVTVVITLRQNYKMIEESTRPYISIYIGSTYFSDTVIYLIIKNFGSSSAVIEEFDSDIDFSICSYDVDHIPFEHIVGTHLCPSESILFPINSYKLSQNAQTINISIKYRASQKIYCEKISVNFDAHCDRAHLRANTQGKHDQEISFALQDIAEKML